MAHHGYDCDETTPLVRFWEQAEVEKALGLTQEQVDSLDSFELSLHFANTAQGRKIQKVKYLYFIIPFSTGTEDWRGEPRDWYENQDAVYMSMARVVAGRAHMRNLPHFWAREDAAQDAEYEFDNYHAELETASRVMPSVVMAWINE